MSVKTRRTAEGAAVATPDTTAPIAPTAPTSGPISREELQLASRNHALPLEMLNWPITPVGMHYLLVHFDVPHIDPVSWRLNIGGLVDHPHEYTLHDLQHRERRTYAVTMECAGNGRSRMEPRPVSQPWDQGGVGTAEWTGTPLAPLLLDAGVSPDAVELVFTGADRGIQGGVEQQYARGLSVADAMSDDVLLAYEVNGQALPPQHGYPVRLLVPGWYGMTSVKWLRSVEAIDHGFDGYQQLRSYRYSQSPDDPGEPVQRIKVRSLMAPPGIPDFFTRQRTVDAGPVQLSGRAWSGNGTIETVEVCVDGVWEQAQLQAPAGPYAWRGWTFTWIATPGTHELACRATDSMGGTQPDAPEWNYLGMGNNDVQRMTVTVRE
ncbi:MULTISPECIES: sulfite oxidase [Arthrobacter]|uniref:Sulfite oxidase n=1 Tax=Arthrobacter terricola TaxID=2547396 RepID=A0A4R5K915_9MICC|nr:MULTISPECIES: sulfite oxidase [Arthrobacter]MBT8159988.1 sulfite oxidase [Arthrobacter sp. GN70]TDF91065.1 sulfite oxidase [Arthrobacter terricola]